MTLQFCIIFKKKVACELYFRSLPGLADSSERAKILSLGILTIFQRLLRTFPFSQQYKIDLRKDNRPYIYIIFIAIKKGYKIYNTLFIKKT